MTRHNRNSPWKPWLILLTLGSTLPVLGLLCRGHSPSRYDTANLPAWERITPDPPKAAVKLLAVPLPSADITFTSLPVVTQLQNADEGRMFSNLDFTRGLPHDRLSAGKPGVWLEQAVVLGTAGSDLRPKIDRVATRLMEDQDNIGYLGAKAPVHAYTAQDIAAHANNLRGLIAYYELTRQPAAFSAATRAGDFLLANYDPWPGQEQTGAEDALVYALARLYQVSGATKYLQFAEREEVTRGCDGLGLCALYEATGTLDYLRLAKRTWRGAQSPTRTTSPQFCSEIFKLTGDPLYLAGLQSCRTTSVWPLHVAYTTGVAGLSVNCLYPSTVQLGAMRLSVAEPPHAATADAKTAKQLIGPPALIRWGNMSLTTVARTNPRVHITFQPGCIADDPDGALQIVLNGKAVDLQSQTAAHLVLQPTSLATPTHKSAPTV